VVLFVVQQTEEVDQAVVVLPNPRVLVSVEMKRPQRDHEPRANPMLIAPRREKRAWKASKLDRWFAVWTIAQPRARQMQTAPLPVSCVSKIKAGQCRAVCRLKSVWTIHLAMSGLNVWPNVVKAGVAWVEVQQPLLALRTTKSAIPLPTALGVPMTNSVAGSTRKAVSRRTEHTNNVYLTIKLMSRLALNV
jgi:hypothetical protein